MSCEAIPRTNWACCCCCSQRQRGASAGAGEQEQPQLLDHARASITGVVVGPMLEMVDPSDDNSVSASRAYESRTLLSRVLSEVFRSLFAFSFLYTYLHYPSVLVLNTYEPSLKQASEKAKRESKERGRGRERERERERGERD